MSQTVDNPYQPIEEPESGSVQYHFDGRVSMRDLGRMHRWARISTLVVMLPASLFMLQLAYDSFRFGANGGGITGLVLAVVFWLTIYHAWRGPHRFVKAYPHIYEPVRGSLGSDFVQIESSAVGHRILSETVVVHAANKNFISLRCDLDRLLIPSMFEDYDSAVRLAKEIQKRSDPMLPGDPRTRDRIPASDETAGPPGSISFAGEQHAGDYEVAAVDAGRKRILQVLVLRLMILICILVFIYLLGVSPVVLVLSVMLGSAWFYKRALKPCMAFLRTAASMKSNPEETFYSIRGWLDEDFIAVWSATGVSRYRWAAFHDSAQQGTESMVLYGQGNRFFLALHRRLFHSDEEWEQATKTMRTRIAECNQD